MSIPRVDPNFGDAELEEVAQRLLDTAQEFWEACHKHNPTHSGAVQWLESNDGRLVIFTRGEYRHTLMRNIDRLPGAETHFFRSTDPDYE